MSKGSKDMIRDRIIEKKTEVIGEAIIDHGNWVIISAIDASWEGPLLHLPFPLQGRIKSGERVKIKITFEEVND